MTFLNIMTSFWISWRHFKPAIGSRTQRHFWTEFSWIKEACLRKTQLSSWTLTEWKWDGHAELLEVKNSGSTLCAPSNMWRYDVRDVFNNSAFPSVKTSFLKLEDLSPLPGLLISKGGDSDNVILFSCRFPLNCAITSIFTDFTPGSWKDFDVGLSLIGSKEMTWITCFDILITCWHLFSPYDSRGLTLIPYQATVETNY